MKTAMEMNQFEKSEAQLLNQKRGPVKLQAIGTIWGTIISRVITNQSRAPLTIAGSVTSAAERSFSSCRS